MSLFEQIKASAKLDDLDEAIRPIQAILGQDDGGVASHFFSDSGIWGDDEHETWKSMAELVRYHHLFAYVGFELVFQQQYGGV